MSRRLRKVSTIAFPAVKPGTLRAWRETVGYDEHDRPVGGFAIDEVDIDASPFLAPLPQLYAGTVDGAALVAEVCALDNFLGHPGRMVDDAPRVVSIEIIARGRLGPIMEARAWCVACSDGATAPTYSDGEWRCDGRSMFVWTGKFKEARVCDGRLVVTLGCIAVTFIPSIEDLARRPGPFAWEEHA